MTRLLQAQFKLTLGRTACGSYAKRCRDRNRDGESGEISYFITLTVPVTCCGRGLAAGFPLGLLSKKPRLMAGLAGCASANMSGALNGHGVIVRAQQRSR